MKADRKTDLQFLKPEKLGDFFREEIEKEPMDFSSVVWHPSAGRDWGPVVFYSKGYLSQKKGYEDLVPATFHVMTNLGGGYGEDLRVILESPERICFEDARTCMRIADFQTLQLKDESLWERPSSRYFYRNERGPRPRELAFDGVLAQMEIRCKESGHVERVPLLYLIAENHATYRQLVGSGLFTVRHLKLVCEGLAFGGCRRSLMKTVAESGLGLSSLQTVWARDGGQVRQILDRMRHERTSLLREMPMCFYGDLFVLGEADAAKDGRLSCEKRKLMKRGDKTEQARGPLDLPLSKHDNTRKFWVLPNGSVLPVEVKHSLTLNRGLEQEFGIVYPEGTDEWEGEARERARRWAAMKVGFVRGIIRLEGELTLEAHHLTPRTFRGIRKLLTYAERRPSKVLGRRVRISFLEQCGNVRLKLLGERDGAILVQNEWCLRGVGESVPRPTAMAGVRTAMLGRTPGREVIRGGSDGAADAFFPDAAPRGSQRETNK